MNRKRRKIAIILPYFGKGGAEHMVAHYVSKLDTSKMEVRVFCLLGDCVEHQAELENEIENNGIPIIHLGKKIGFSIKGIRALDKALTAYSPDVVHTHLNAFVYATPWVLSHPSVRMYHTMHTVPQKENRRFVRRWLSRFMVKSGRTVPIAISDSNAVLIAQYYDIAQTRVPIIYNPVDTNKYYQDRELSEDFEFVFITVGRLIPLKNHKTIIDGFMIFQKRCNANAALWIVGSGELENELKQYVNKADGNQNILFWGYRTDIADLLAKAHVFVLASDFEGLPLCLLEAMAAELPIIATRVGGVPDIVTDNGILIKPRDVLQMSEAMEKLYRNRILWEGFSKKALSHVSQYDVMQITKQYERLYHDHTCENI